MAPSFEHNRYDVIIAGARCAGASTAMLLARQGLRVLVVDPVQQGHDTLSTHAMMRGGVLQLRRWGILDRVRAAETPPIRSTTFHYGNETVEVSIKEKDGVDALFAPRRTVLDPILAEAAMAAGAEVVYGYSVMDLEFDEHDRVYAAVIADRSQTVTRVVADLVIGADGIRSRVARIVSAPMDYQADHMSAAIYGYWRGLPHEGYHWYYEVGAGVGAIPTNNGETCVFVSVPSDRFQEDRLRGLEPLFHDALRQVSTELAENVCRSDGPGHLRAFPGMPGFLRRAAGPGWALVGDAGYFRDPITAHGITDALHDAELLSRMVLEGHDRYRTDYQPARDERVRELLDISDRVAAFDWSLEEVKQHHLDLNREMNRQIKALHAA